MTRHLLIIFTLLYSFEVLAFEEVEVTPADSKGWFAANVRDDGMVEINQDQPLFGDGSLMFFTDTITNGQDKADYQLQWQLSENLIDFPQRNLGSISDVSFAWYRDSMSDTRENLAPVLRLVFYDDGESPTDFSDDVFGLLIWEAVYNGVGVVAEDSWQLFDLANDNFWVFVSQSAQGSGVIENFNATLNDWITGSPQGQAGNPQINLTANTYILGINVGVGSGWGDSFLGYVDAVRIAFGSQDDFLYNFEACQVFVPNDNPDVIFDDSFECFKRL